MARSYDTIVEKVPSLLKRDGDAAFAGSNNASVILGSDRKNSVNSGYGNSEKAGAIYAVAGRQSDNYDLINDSAFLYLSMKADPDDYAGISDGVSDKTTPTAILKADHVRFVARKKLKIIVGSCKLSLESNGTITIDGVKIKFGTNSVERALKGDSFATEFAVHTHPTPTGPSGPPVVPLSANIYSRKVTLE